MNNRKKIALALSTSFILPAMSAHVYAQTASQPQANSTDILQDIIVTARRREENLQNVPVSVTALSGDEIKDKGSVNLVELSRMVPNFNVIGQSTNPQAFTIGIRGIRNREVFGFFDPSVSTIFNDIVVAHPYGVGDSMFDIANIQILKGPQGTLYGRNSTGGAVIIQPNSPSLSEGFSGTISGSIGSYELRQLNLAVNIPVSDWAALRVAGESRKRDGYMTNVLTDEKWNNINNEAARVSLLLEPTSNLRSTTVFDYLKEHSAPYATVNAAIIPGSSFSTQGGLANAQALLNEQQNRSIYKFASYTGTFGPLDTLQPSRCLPGSPAPFQSPGSPFPDECRDYDINNLVRLKNWGISNNTAWNLSDNVTLKNIIAYRKLTRSSFQQSWINDAATFQGGVGNQTITGNPYIKQFTEELQLSGTSFDDRLNWVAGYFYLRETGQEYAFGLLGTGFNNSTTNSETYGWFKNVAHGFYAQGTFKLTDKLNLTAGVRQSIDIRDARAINGTQDTVTNVFTCGYYDGSTSNRLPGNTTDCQLSGHHNSKALTWTAAADYEVADRTRVYASVSKGYKAGGFQPRAARASLFEFDPEFIMSYEVGVKSEWSLAGRPVRTNLSVYQADNTDMQVQIQDVESFPVTQYIANAGKSRYRGFEFESRFQATRDLTINAYASYTDFKYLRYESGGVDLSWQTSSVPLSHWAAGGSATYHIPVGKGGIDLRADMAYTSKVVTNNVTNPRVKADYPQKAYTIVNARVDWDTPFDQPIRIGFWVTNLTKEVYSTGSTCITGLCSIVPSAPRMYGADISYRF